MPRGSLRRMERVWAGSSRPATHRESGPMRLSGGYSGEKTGGTHGLRMELCGWACNVTRRRGGGATVVLAGTSGRGYNGSGSSATRTTVARLLVRGTKEVGYGDRTEAAQRNR
jgi:hypothetical protein